MNDKRRKDIAKAADLIAQAITLLEIARDEEQDFYDNMPEAFQNGERGEKAQEAIGALETAVDEAGSIADNLNEITGA
jgi:hypothetical protein